MGDFVSHLLVKASVLLVRGRGAGRGQASGTRKCVYAEGHKNTGGGCSSEPR